MLQLRFIKSLRTVNNFPIFLLLKVKLKENT